MQRLEFTRGIVLIDDEDMWVTADYYLRAEVQRNGYQVVTLQDKRTGKKTTLGRTILGITDPRLQADHINQDGFDNRRENLRIVDRDLQNANRRSQNAHGYKGVSFSATFKNSPYRGGLRRNGVLYYGPYRPSPEQAALDFNRMATALWGQKIFLNEVRCVAVEPRPSQQLCLFCNAPCHCCCVCLDPPSKGMQRLFDSLDAS